jgi:hypothetical protein
VAATQTAIEAGYLDFETLAWWGILASKDTPPDVIASMAKSVKEILSDPAVARNLQETQQMSLLLGDAWDFQTFFAKQVNIWARSSARIISRRRDGTWISRPDLRTAQCCGRRQAAVACRLDVPLAAPSLTTANGRTAVRKTGFRCTSDACLMP